MPIIKVQQIEENNVSYESTILEMKIASYSVMMDIMNEVNIDCLYESEEAKKDSLVAKIKKFFDTKSNEIKSILSSLKAKVLKNKKVTDSAIKQVEKNSEKHSYKIKNTAETKLIDNQIFNDMNFRFDINPGKFADLVAFDDAATERSIEAVLDDYFWGSIPRSLWDNYPKDKKEKRQYTINISDYEYEEIIDSTKKYKMVLSSLKRTRDYASEFIELIEKETIDKFLKAITDLKENIVNTIEEKYGSYDNIDIKNTVNTAIKNVTKIFDGIYNITNDAATMAYKVCNELFMYTTKEAIRLNKIVMGESTNESTVEISVDDLMYLVSI